MKRPAAIAAALSLALKDPQGYVADPRQFMTWDAVAERTMQVYRYIAPERAPALRADAAASLS